MRSRYEENRADRSDEGVAKTHVTRASVAPDDAEANDDKVLIK